MRTLDDKQIIDQDYVPTKIEIGEIYVINWVRKGARYKMQEFRGSQDAILMHTTTKNLTKTPLDTLRLQIADVRRAAKKRLKK